MRIGWMMFGSALLLPCLSGQWAMQHSGTTASFRGVEAVSDNVAWVSGSHGTVLRTTNGGQAWERCMTPPGAEKLDFRAVQAWDENKALVMSSGDGDTSRVYKTTDGCKSWKLLFSNPDAPAGFFDGLRVKAGTAELIGDPVHGVFALFRSDDYGDSWKKAHQPPTAKPGEALFAASNSALIELPGGALFVTGGAVSRSRARAMDAPGDSFVGGDLPMGGRESSGAFSVAARNNGIALVAVGGDYLHPDNRERTCATSGDGGGHWLACAEPPGGYRSAVAFDSLSNTWIAVGPSGTDVSTDDGQHWKPLKPSASNSSDADKDWNALSLPFVAGNHGRIGKLERIRLQ